MPSTLCWKCLKAYGGCSWSSSLEPVKGWEVVKGEISCCVKSCPEFKEDPRCLSTEGILKVSVVSKLLKINERTYYRKSIEELEKMAISRELPIYYDKAKKGWLYK